jgi:hypothetical protein
MTITVCFFFFDFPSGCEAFDDLTKNTKISKWFDLMKEECKNHGGQGMIQDKTISLH